MIKTTTMAAVVATLAGTAFAAGIMTPNAFAAADTNTANDIKIAENGNGSTINDRTFTAYKLASYKDAQFDEKGDKVTGYDLTSTIEDAALRNAIKTAITNTDGTVKDAYKDVASITKDNNNNNNDVLTFKGDDASLSAIQFIGKHFYGDADDVYGNNHANKADMRTLADALTKAGLDAFGDPVTGADGAASFDLGDDDLGLYLIVEGTHAADGQTVSRAMVIGSPFKYDDGKGNVKYVTTVQGATKDDGSQDDVKVGTINLKADKVTVTKDVIGDDKLIGLDSVRTFQIDTNVPNYKTEYQNWDNPVFRIQDNPSDNLTVSAKGDFTDIQNLKVQANTGADGAYEDIDVAKYAVSANTTTDDANDFTITLNTPADYSGKKIRVTYDATVNAVADTTDNDTNIEFSNDPYTVDSLDTTPNDKEKLYEAELDLSKVKFNDAATKLAGAEFTVKKDGKDVYFAQNGNTFVLSNRENSNRVHIKFEENTDVKLRGLAADTDANGATYTFTEAKAPEGYILGKNPVTFSVTIKPVFGNDGELEKVQYSIDAGAFANFLDLSAISRDANNPTDGTLVNTDGTVYSAAATIENTTNLNDFAKTGGQISAYILSAVALAVAGAFVSVLARRNREKKTA